MSYNTRRASYGKRLRMQEEQEEMEVDQQDNTGGGEAEDESFDPIAFYQQQRQEMLMKAKQVRKINYNGLSKGKDG